MPVKNIFTKLSKLLRKFLKLPKKILFLVLISALVLGFFGLRMAQSNAPILQFSEVKRGDVKAEVSAAGVLNGKNTTDLKFRNGGKVAFVNVKTGDRVSAGNTIAGLDTQDLTIKLQIAQNNLTDKEAILQKILDDIHLFQYGNGGFSNVGTANETATQRKERISAEEAVNNATESVKDAQRAFQDSVITAPYNGVITQVKAVAGQNVSGSDLVATISDNSEIFFDADVDQADISKVKLDQMAEITLDSSTNKTFKGKVTEMAGQTKTTSNNATVILVRIKLLDTPPNFISGLSGQVSITIEEVKDVLSLPLEAIKEDNTVVIQQNSRFRPQKIEVGIKSDTETEIKSGLKEGERVLLNPPANFNFRNMQNPLTRILRLPGGGTRGRQAN